mmetsp:Transcript_8528/g.20968  ORF Transcript_8528/g.20968 Transcript_8528/m.20968 type:complete len:376 (-) Transcript_8528:1294-2421(-)
MPSLVHRALEESLYDSSERRLSHNQAKLGSIPSDILQTLRRQCDSLFLDVSTITIDVEATQAYLRVLQQLLEPLGHRLHCHLRNVKDIRILAKCNLDSSHEPITHSGAHNRWSPLNIETHTTNTIPLVASQFFENRSTKLVRSRCVLDVHYSHAQIFKREKSRIREAGPRTIRIQGREKLFEKCPVLATLVRVEKLDVGMSMYQVPVVQGLQSLLEFRERLSLSEIDANNLSVFIRDVVESLVNTIMPELDHLGWLANVIGMQNLAPTHRHLLLPHLQFLAIDSIRDVAPEPSPRGPSIVPKLAIKLRHVTDLGTLSTLEWRDASFLVSSQTLLPAQLESQKDCYSPLFHHLSKGIGSHSMIRRKHELLNQPKVH